MSEILYVMFSIKYNINIKYYINNKTPTNVGVLFYYYLLLCISLNIININIIYIITNTHNQG